MENVLAFLRAAMPWISLGLLVMFFCVRPNIRRHRGVVLLASVVVCSSVFARTYADTGRRRIMLRRECVWACALVWPSAL